MRYWKRSTGTAAIILAVTCIQVLHIYGQCPGGQCPSGQCPKSPPAWRPKSPENSMQCPAVVHVNFQWQGETIAMGSGFIADEDKDRNVAVVVTCAHGYKPLMNMEIVTQDGRAYKSKLLGVDPIQDLLIVQISDPGITPLVVAAELPSIGDRVYMAGFPRGESFYGSWGKVEGWYNPEGSNGDNYVATTCDAQPGCSGGPVMNEKSEVVATVTGTFGGHSCVGPCLAKTLHLVRCENVQDDSGYDVYEPISFGGDRYEVEVIVCPRCGYVFVRVGGIIVRSGRIVARAERPSRYPFRGRYVPGPNRHGLPGQPVRRASGSRPCPRPPVAERRGSPRPQGGQRCPAGRCRVAA